MRITARLMGKPLPVFPSTTSPSRSCRQAENLIASLKCNASNVSHQNNQIGVKSSSKSTLTYSNDGDDEQDLQKVFAYNQQFGNVTSCGLGLVLAFRHS